MNEDAIVVLADMLKTEKNVIENFIKTGDKNLLNDLKVKHLLTSDEYQLLETNLSKKSYEDGKIAGVEMELKKLKDKLNFKPKNAEDVLNYIENIKQNTEKQTSETWQNDREKLLNEFKNLQVEFETEKNKLLSENIKIKNEIAFDNLLNSINLNVPLSIGKNAKSQKDKDLEVGEYLKKQKNNLKVLISNNYDYEIIDNELIFRNKKGEIITDKLKTPVKPEIIIKEFAKQNYIDYEEELPKGRAGENRNHNNYNHFNSSTYPDFVNELKQKGINENTIEFSKLYVEWKKQNS